jgi:hypothetical protein
MLLKKEMKVHLPLGEVEHGLQLLQDAHQFLCQILVRMDLHSMHCDVPSDQKRN